MSGWPNSEKMHISVLNKPTLAITMGDAAGIGPEVVLKALANPQIQVLARFFIIGDYNWLEKTRQSLNLDLKLVKFRYNQITEEKLKGIFADKSIFEDKEQGVFCLDLDNLPPGDWYPGRVNRICGQASVEYIETAFHLAITSSVEAIVTAPISKKAIHQAGHKWPGHTEFLAAKAGVKDFAMMLVGRGLRVVLATTHLALNQVSRNLSREEIVKKLRLTNTWLSRYFGIKKPRIAVCGLNPHCGESGAFGMEEIRFIRPAVLEAQKENIEAVGPLPADTVFYRALKGKFDAVLAMYHDQGLGPLKLIAFDEGVNITLGLPFIRTSPDHGTAFDLMGQNKANCRSMEQAVITAVAMCQQKHTS